ncbi:MAG: PilZ domain-containing protein [Terriglobales bacterium]
MNLQALLLCSDDKIVRVLRRVLNELEIVVEHCPTADAAIQKLTRNRFEAVIVDCTGEQLASSVLKSARSAPCNKRAVAVAIVDGQKALGSAFDLGAHFVLYTPISVERAKSSFRAARALMKRERRRNNRIPVEIKVTLNFEGKEDQSAVTSDIGEGGIALSLTRRPKNGARMKVRFVLPGTEYNFQSTGEVAWENAQRQTGIRFVDLPADVQVQLNAWLTRHSPDLEKDDPPVPCKLTDLSLGGCYLELASPFPVRTKLTLSMRAGETELRVEGIVRVMHPELGMGVEFTQKTGIQKEQVERFIQTLTGSNGVVPDLMVQPESLDVSDESSVQNQVVADTDDPLLDLFLKKSTLTPQAFQVELSKQRGSHSQPEAASAASV